MAHGPDKIAAAIGVWKSGAAFVSVDTVHKDHGVKDLFSHTRSPIILTDSENEARARLLAGPDGVVFETSSVLAHLIGDRWRYRTPANDRRAAPRHRLRYAIPPLFCRPCPTQRLLADCRSRHPTIWCGDEEKTTARIL